MNDWYTFYTYKTSLILQVSPLFGTIYSSIMFIAHAMESLRASGQWMSGDNLAKHARNLTFKGFSHPIRTSHSGLSLLDYVVLDTDGLSWELRPCYRIEMETDKVHFLGQSIHFPGSGPPKTDSSCWFTQGIICGGGGRYTHTQAFISFTRSTDL